MLSGKYIVVGVTGSIAAYKAASLCSLLIKAGAEVQVIMTENATRFVTPLTFESLTKKKCLTDTFDRNFEYKIGHISVAKRADAFIIAPATANIIAKVANGLADDMLSTTFLAATCPKLLSPAMNTAMYENPVTKGNLQKCRDFGYTVLEPASGRLACGDIGAGKMPEPEELFKQIEYAVGYKKDLKGKKLLVTAGPTQEALDPVRYLTNHSTGKMGYAIAKIAAYRGAEVTLISGPVSLSAPPHVHTVNVTSASEMFVAVKNLYADKDIIIKAAAVADYRPMQVATEKIKKAGGALELSLERTDDILLWLGKNKRAGQFLCGFCMETENLLDNAKDKLLKKNADMIVANSLRMAGSGFGTDTNIVTLVTKSETEELPLLSKDEVADRLLSRIAKKL